MYDTLIIILLFSPAPPGLLPNKVQNVMVRARCPKAPYDEENSKKKLEMLSGKIAFKTQPGGKYGLMNVGRYTETFL